ncbi:hypothetical protein [Actinomycetospora sp. NBRC 106378]|uniref:hypothetical protein n=1 Tax=Actinomycetospora sp. NBRC 106378 TaxID=3032208 RepID=UPI0024A24114|nr:hypothetical protein [Actinomycetospora sp. NBRC 106378]GLZ51706.1 hypothetical protein Acsp07_13230 [Actinomycetospora sp. NBRC 106378]
MNGALKHALHTLTARTAVRGVSDEALPIRADLPHARLAACAALNGPQPVVPLEALRGLAVASAATLSADLLQVQANWAVARYVGSFEHKKDHLVLSEPGEAVCGNQRRVLSEELGIAFGLHTGSRWMASRADPASPIWVADVDQLPARLVSWAAKSEHRPDFVLAARRPGHTNFTVALVESKGTRTPSHVKKAWRAGADRSHPQFEI